MNLAQLTKANELQEQIQYFRRKLKDLDELFNDDKYGSIVLDRKYMKKYRSKIENMLSEILNEVDSEFNKL